MEERLQELYSRIGYPKEWLEEAQRYNPEDSYVIFDPAWGNGEMPEVPPVSIYGLFHETAQRVPDETAIIFLGKGITYRELDDMINRYASLLLGLGVGKGDVVSAMLPNSLQHWVAFYGANRIGASHNPINVMYKSEEIVYQLQDSGAKTVLVLDFLYNMHFSSVREKTGLDNVIITHVRDFAAPDYEPQAGTLKLLWDAPKVTSDDTIDFFEAVRGQPLYEGETECDPKSDVALLLYTAGTTAALPKGVLETHFNLVFNSLSHAHLLIQLGEEKEVNLSIMPMFHTSGYMLHALPCFYQGGTVIPMPLFDLEEALNLIEERGVNVLFGPPTLFTAFLQSPAMSKQKVSSLKYTIACGAPVPPAVQEEWEKLVGLTLNNGWGMTETNSGGSISVPGKKEKEGALGIPVAGEIRITDPEGKVLPRGETGEINFRGLQVAKGYLNKPEDTALSFQADGWLKTGDMGYIDEEDFLYFVDRKKDLIIASGYNIAPVEVENVLYRHPAVLEASVVGMPDEYRGETVTAAILLKEEYRGKVSEEEFIEFCRERLATFKVPRKVVFREELPKSAIGKILRRVLREELSAEAEPS